MASYGFSDDDDDDIDACLTVPPQAHKKQKTFEQPSSKLTPVAPAKDLKLYSRERLESFYKGQTNDPAQHKAVENFFALRYFFTSRPNVTFWKGTSVDDGKCRVYVSLADIPQVHEGLAAALELGSASALSTPGNLASDVKDPEPVVFKTQEAWTALSRSMQKHNKSVKSRLASLAREKTLRDAVKMVKEGKSVFVAVDAEVYERDHSVVLELGWSIYDTHGPIPDSHPEDEMGNDAYRSPSLSDRRHITRHYCNSDYKHVCNGQFVSDRKNMFNFGKSRWAPIEAAAESIRNDLEGLGDFVLVGHNLDADIKFLKSIGVHIPENCVTLDTGDMDMAIRGAIQPMSLGKLLDRLNIEFYSLHNAGNDARYTMEAFLQMARTN